MTRYQKLIALLGMGYAHPGGKSATSIWMDLLPVSNYINILEVGCGTGETLLSLHNKYNANIIGIDVSQQMIKTARKQTEEISAISVLQTNAEKLPFEEGQFNLIVCESVLSFTNAAHSLKEITRVLDCKGSVVLLEMTADPRLNQLDKEIIQDFYQIPQLFTRFEWLKLLLENGFAEVTVMQINKHNEDSLPTNRNIHWTDAMLETLETHYHLNEQYSDSLHAYLFIATKAGGKVSK